MIHLRELFSSSSLIVLDGGLGTTLEDVFHKDISHTPLWSAEPIDTDPEIIINAHLAFLRAGAQIILTSTYQCAIDSFKRAGYGPDAAERIMMQSVKLAEEARTRYLNEQKDSGPKHIKIALSLGPYGATLNPTQEFNGFYPPPYGPKAYSPLGENRNTYAITEEDEENMAVDALTKFHLERLQMFALRSDIWDVIDCLAFETIPLLREVKAIRRAMDILTKDNVVNGLKAKPWWISSIFPDGRYPQEKRQDDEAIGVRDVVDAVLGRDNRDLARPDAYGVNCTATGFLPKLINEAEKTVKDIFKGVPEKPWLVIYPNGGDTYDPSSRTWIEENKDEKKGSTWAKELVRIVHQARNSGIWDGVIVGGCCRTGPDEIRALVEGLNSSSD